jgi:hypothetical protein
MTEIGDKFAAYRPTKTIWFWSTVVVMVVTVIVGFTWGGWVTGGSAADRAEDAAEGAVAALAADICAFRFLQAGDAGTQLTALKEESSYKRNSALEEGGWVTFAGAEKPVSGAARLCAERLMEAELKSAATPVAEVTEAAPAS